MALQDEPGTGPLMVTMGILYHLALDLFGYFFYGYIASEVELSCAAEYIITPIFQIIMMWRKHTFS